MGEGESDEMGEGEWVRVNRLRWVSEGESVRVNG